MGGGVRERFHSADVLLLLVSRKKLPSLRLKKKNGKGQQKSDEKVCEIDGRQGKCGPSCERSVHGTRRL